MYHGLNLGQYCYPDKHTTFNFVDFNICHFEVIVDDGVSVLTVVFVCYDSKSGTLTW